MVKGPSDFEERERLRLERSFIEQQKDRFAGRGLAYLIILNGAGALIMTAAFVFGFQTSAEPKLAAAMLVFSAGAIAALVSLFIAYLNRIARIELPDNPRLPSILRMIGIAAVLASGTAFISGVSMVGTSSTAKSSSQPKTRLQDKALAREGEKSQKDASRMAPGDSSR